MQSKPINAEILQELKAADNKLDGKTVLLSNSTPKIGQQSPPKCKTRQKRRYSYTDPVFQYLPGRKRVKPTRIDVQVKRFCKDVEKFKHYQIEKGHIIQVPDVF